MIRTAVRNSQPETVSGTPNEASAVKKECCGKTQLTALLTITEKREHKVKRGRSSEYLRVCSETRHAFLSKDNCSFGEQIGRGCAASNTKTARASVRVLRP